MDYLGSHDDLWCDIGPIIAVDLKVGESGVLFLTELSVGHACPTKKERDVCRGERRYLLYFHSSLLAIVKCRSKYICEYC